MSAVPSDVPVASRRSPMRAIGGVLADAALPVGTTIAVIGVWQLISSIASFPEYILPAPTAVADAGAQNAGSLASETLVTLLETLVGFGLAVAFALPLAVAIVVWPPLKKSIYPLLILVQSVPKVALAPIFLVWIGFGPWPKILIAALACFFPVFLDAAAGFASTPRDAVDLFRSLRAKKSQIFWKLRVPHALPHVFVGLKVGVTFAVIGAVVGEFVQSSEGLGYLILISSSQLKTDLAFAAMILLALISIVLFYVLEWIEQLVVPWAEHRAGEA